MLIVKKICIDKINNNHHVTEYFFKKREIDAYCQVLTGDSFYTCFLRGILSRTTCPFAAAKRPGSETSDVVACSATLQVLASLASDPGVTASGTCTPSCYQHNKVCHHLFL